MLLTSAKTFIEVNVLNEEFKSNIHLIAFHNIWGLFLLNHTVWYYLYPINIRAERVRVFLPMSFNVKTSPWKLCRKPIHFKWTFGFKPEPVMSLAFSSIYMTGYIFRFTSNCVPKKSCNWILHYNNDFNSWTLSCENESLSSSRKTCQC